MATKHRDVVKPTQEMTDLQRYARTTPNRLYLRHDISFHDWLRVGRQLLRISSASNWWLGDWLVYGERTYRHRYKAALERTPLDYQTLRNYAWVARRVAMSRRRDSLSFQHHAEVAALPEDEQELWLGRAESGGWSRNELRRQLAEAGGGRRVASERRPVVLQIRVAGARERRWCEAADAAQQELADWVASVADSAAQAVLSAASPQRALPPGEGGTAER